MQLDAARHSQGIEIVVINGSVFVKLYSSATNEELIGSRQSLNGFNSIAGQKSEREAKKESFEHRTINFGVLKKSA